LLDKVKNQPYQTFKDGSNCASTDRPTPARVHAPIANRIGAILEGSEYILGGAPGASDGPDDRRKRFLESSEALRRAHALSVPHPDALAIADEMGFILAIKARLQKVVTSTGTRSDVDIDTAISQIVSRAVMPEGVVDIFEEAGVKKPDVSILSDEFLEEVASMPQRNLAAEALQRLLEDQIRIRGRKNTVQARKFSDLLEASIRRYQNRTIEAAQVILELIELAKDMRAADERAEELDLSENELAFYDALAANESAVEVLGDETLKNLALELVDTVRRNATIDWTVKESVKANLRRLVRRALTRYGYPPDLQAEAIITVLRPAEFMASEEAA
jgi:type I restriction enzyme R subunit